MTMIRADYLEFAIRSELGEQRAYRKTLDLNPDATDAEKAWLDGNIEALEWAQQQVALRAKKAAA